MIKALQGTIAAAVIGSSAFLGFGANGDAQAAPRQEGLVNVALVDTTVQVPIAIAANICDVDVNVLADQIDAGDLTCDTEAGSAAVTAPDSGDGGRANQEGLVNLYSDDLTIQLPIAVAANVCDISVNVLAQQVALGDAACTATADSGAQG